MDFVLCIWNLGTRTLGCHVAICWFKRFSIVLAFCSSRHFAMAHEDLLNLSEQSARIGTWVLAVATEPRQEDYQYAKGQGKGSGKKFECLLVSSDSDAYCVQRCLVRAATMYRGCPHKVVIDMNASKFEPVLQSTVKMPQQCSRAQ